MGDSRAALVIGAGPGLGASICRRFGREGFTICGVRRRHADELDDLCREIGDAGGEAHGFTTDMRNEEEVVALFDKIEKDIGPLRVVVFNPGANVSFSIEETTTRVFTKVWEMACFAGFLVGREAARRMLPRAEGTILFTGATASVRGGAGFSAFASAKAGLRSVAQSMARELGPKGIHVGHVVIDGGIDGAFIREMMGDRLKEMPPDAILDPEDIAETYWALHAQRRSAWTFEADVRPWTERW
ncbi:MAG: SDR family oxidoreductase [Candidatus Binatia bacterium]|nr:SDR family oxidoreductase [Candidatus Binatia bacterium]